MEDVLTQYYGFITEFVDATLEANLPRLTMVNNGIGHYEYWGAKCFDHGSTYPEFKDDPIEVILFDLPSVSRRMLKWICRWMEKEPFQSFVDVEVPYKGDDITIRCHYDISKLIHEDRQLQVYIEWKELEEQ